MAIFKVLLGLMGFVGSSAASITITFWTSIMSAAFSIMAHPVH